MASLHGESNPRAVLSASQVARMRDLHDNGWGYKRLAREFGVSRRTVQRICKWERWYRMA